MENFEANVYYATVFRDLLEDGTIEAIKKLNDINNIRGGCISEGSGAYISRQALTHSSIAWNLYHNNRKIFDIPLHI